MKTETAVRDVRGANVLCGGQHVFDPHRQQRAQRNLEWPDIQVDVGISPGARVQIDAIGTDTHAVGILRRSPGPARFQRNVLLPDHEFCSNAARLTTVRLLRQSIRRAEGLAVEPQAREAGSPVRTWRLGLQPIEKTEAELPGLITRPRARFLADADQRPQPVVVLGPVHDDDVAHVPIEVRPIENAPVRPQVHPIVRHRGASHRPAVRLGRIVEVQPGGDRLRRDGMRVAPSQVRTGPERRLVRAPELVHCRAPDGVILTRPVLDG